MSGEFCYRSPAFRPGGSSLPPVPKTILTEQRNSMDNDQHWNQDTLYFNKADTRFLVPKKNPWLGWTINLGHPLAPITLVGLLTLPPLFLAAYAKRR